MCSNVNKTAQFDLNIVAMVEISCCLPICNNRAMTDVTEDGTCFFQVPQDPVEVTGADLASYVCKSTHRTVPSDLRKTPK